MPVEQSLDASSRVLGAGGYGIVLEACPSTAVKLFYDTTTASAASLKDEAEIQQRAAQLLKGIVRVPKITEYMALPFVWSGATYLYGITMEAIEPPAEFGGHQLHVLLGYGGSDLDSVWLKHAGAPAGPVANPPRGFFAGPETLEDHWQDRGSSWTVERAAWAMGVAIGTLIAGGIVPIDLEFIYGADDNLWLIDFGLCRVGSVDPRAFLEQRGSEGLASDIYVPQEGMRGRAEFLAGYAAATGITATS